MWYGKCGNRTGTGNVWNGLMGLGAGHTSTNNSYLENLEACIYSIGLPYIKLERPDWLQRRQ